jgi:hypothetical protein
MDALDSRVEEEKEARLIETLHKKKLFNVASD